MFRTCAVETLKLFISLFLLLANLYFQVLSNLVKTRLLLHISYTLETFHKSSVTTSKISEVIDDSFVAEIWSFMTFRGGFLIITSKLIKSEASFFSGCYFISLSILLPNLLFISWILLKITAVPKTHSQDNSLNFALFWCTILYSD